VIKDLGKYPVLFCILLIAGYSLPFHHTSNVHSRFSTLKNSGLSKEFVGRDLIIRAALPHAEKKNVEHDIVRSEIDEEESASSKKHVDDGDPIYSGLSCFLTHGRLPSFNSDKYFSYTATYRYLAFQVFRI
jgi:hypothetical protein